MQIGFDVKDSKKIAPKMTVKYENLSAWIVLSFGKFTFAHLVFY